jgi:mono/diheme cytochrome c family protein
MQQHHSDVPPAYTSGPRPPKIGRPPFWMMAIALIGVVGSWLPLVLFARAKAALSTQPRVAMVQDMGVQPKYREQQSSEIFADGRADRPVIEGTVARGELHEDTAYYLGYTMETDAKTGKPAAKFLDSFPEQVTVDDALLKRGQQRFNIYCSVCHGLDGQGNGPVNARALELQNDDPRNAHWTQVANLTSDLVRSRPDGHIYNTINVGIRNMPPYGPQVPTADRWAIVAYVRALQLTYDAPSKILPDDIKDRAKAATKK